MTIPFYNLSLVLTKVSIILFYLHLFPQPWFTFAVKLVMVIVIFYGLWAVLSGFLFCIPVSAFWDSSIKYKCLPKKPVWFFNASMNIATDLAIFLLPMPVLSHLNLPWRQKIGVFLIFGVGLLYVLIPSQSTIYLALGG